MKTGFIFWFVGLPGCGKSSLARFLAEKLATKGLDIVLLEMDERRKKYFPQPSYTKEERELAYQMFAEEGLALAKEGKGVILDGTAYKQKYRSFLRARFSPFAEIYVKCTLNTAMERESKRPQGKVMANLYAKALERKKTGKQFPGLGEVIGVDVPFEEDSKAEFTLENDFLSLEEAREKIYAFAINWLKEKGVCE
ncbi:MAG: adenylylsulfate kinase [Desulfonauticus sp.]|nr:MAG: Putative adenylylsulfate kinase [Desulfonauticus sp. 38_4375]MDK2921544.1 adenylylsulfate kinase [Desulfonauticus sp.]